MVNTPETQSSPLARKLASSAGYYAFLVFFLVLLSAQGSFVNDMYTPALPSMCRFFGCSVSLAQLGLTMGMIGLGVGQTILGPVSDKFGRKPTLIAATALFIVAAVASTFAPSIHVFNLCRLFQGLGASAGYFLAKTIPADVYGGRRLARLMALVGAINGVAPAAAPVAGGVLTRQLGWKSVFVVLAVFAVVLIVLSLKMKESLAPANRAKGSIWAGFKTYRLLLVNRPFMVHTSLKGVSLGLLFAYVSSSPFIFQTHYGLQADTYGFLVGFNSIFLAIGSIVSLKFKPYKKAAFAGALIAMVAVAGQAVSLWFIDSLWFYDMCLIVMLFACGMLYASSNTLAMNEGRAHAGEAAAIIGVAGYIVGATVAPLSGIGNLLHSAAIVQCVLAVLVVLIAMASRRLPSDLQ